MIKSNSKQCKPPVRIGHGYDVHAFEEGAGLVLGGVTIPFDKAFIAHSDGDVLIHALCDAILGALGKGDIGRHFPDTDAQYCNMDSRIFLRKIYQLMCEEEYVLSNADISIVAQAPKMAGHLAAMEKNISADLLCDKEQINIKATTTEKLGYVGRGEGVACHAVVLLAYNGDIASSTENQQTSEDV